MFYETQCGLSTEKTRFLTSLRRGSPPLETPIPASVRELESLQPVKTMKPFCAHLSGHWILEKSQCSSCRWDGRKHLFPPPTSPYHPYHRNRKPRRRLRCCRRSSRYGSGPRTNLARGGCEASLSTPRILKQLSATFSTCFFFCFFFPFSLSPERGHSGFFSCSLLEQLSIIFSVFFFIL